jgi:hypothetical protein
MDKSLMQFSPSEEIAGVKLRDIRRVFRSLNDGGAFHIENLSCRLKLNPQQGDDLLIELIGQECQLTLWRENYVTVNSMT